MVVLIESISLTFFWLDLIPPTSAQILNSRNPPLCLLYCQFSSSTASSQLCTNLCFLSSLKSISYLQFLLEALFYFLDQSFIYSFFIPILKDLLPSFCHPHHSSKANKTFFIKDLKTFMLSKPSWYILISHHPWPSSVREQSWSLFAPRNTFLLSFLMPPILGLEPLSYIPSPFYFISFYFETGY